MYHTRASVKRGALPPVHDQPWHAKRPRNAVLVDASTQTDSETSPTDAQDPRSGGASAASEPKDLTGLERAVANIMPMLQWQQPPPFRDGVLRHAYNLYHALGLPVSADREMIGRRVRDLLLRTHTDRLQAATPEVRAAGVDLYVHVTWIKEVLLDAQRRGRYDMLLARHYRDGEGRLGERRYIPHGGTANTDLDALARFVDDKVDHYTPRLAHLASPLQLPPVPPTLFIALAVPFE